MTAHYVYRVFDAEKRLIYVGCTGNLVQRLRFHGYGYTAWWSDQAAKVVAKVYPSQQIARRVESEVIRAERPRWNISGKWSTNADWGEADFEDFILALINSPEFGPGTLRRARRIDDIFYRRHGRRSDIDWSDAEAYIAAGKPNRDVA